MEIRDMRVGARVISWAVASAMVVATPAAAADALHPTVVELFQSQGCSSCPPAIANINAIADRPDVLALTFAVTYWDSLGWKDTFARPEFTARQWDYAHAYGHAQVGTPQTVINGRVFTNGGDARELVGSIRSADRATSGPPVSSAKGKIMIGKGPAGDQALVWLVRYDPRPLSVPIRAGENGGRTLVHRNVVRSIERVGTWSGAPVTLSVKPPADSHLRSALLVQSIRRAAIIAAAKI